MTNEILINKYNTATFIGEVSDKMIKHRYFLDELFEAQSKETAFYVIEFSDSKPTLRAVQSSFKGAYSYMNPDRILATIEKQNYSQQ